jgi:hypothetical protein
VKDKIQLCADRAAALYREGVQFREAVKIAAQEHFGKYWYQYLPEVCSELGRRGAAKKAANKRETRKEQVQLNLF